MPEQFVQTYWVRLKVTGSGDSVHESDVALTLLSLWVAVFAGGKKSCSRGAVVVWSVLGAVSKEVALFTKVAKFVGMTWFPTIPCY